ncbi:MAG: hypothetical protein WC069_05890 [Candidatus Shapirobacteria bacterium]
MATPTESLQNKANALSTGLNNSRTAYAPNTSPTSSDVSLDSQLASINKQIEDAKSKNLRKTWYGNDTQNPQDEVAPSDGLIVGGLKALSKPLNAIAGAAQYAVGKGTSGSLSGNVNNALKSGLTFGNILEQEGAPRAVQIPLGFALDVMFDPINWLTAGTAALIPRVGTGLVKGALKEGGIKAGVEAAASGAKSSIASKAATAMNLVPFAKRSSAYSNLAEKIGKSAISSAEKYDSLIGSDIYDRLGKGIAGMKSGVIGNTAESLIRKIPSTTILGKVTPSGEKIADFFKYSPASASKVADLKDQVTRLAKDQGAVLTRTADGAHFVNVDDFLKPNAAINLADKSGEVMNVAIRDADGVLKPEFTGQVKILDSVENAQSLLEVAKDDYNIKHLAQAYKTYEPGKTGVQWYDTAVEKIKSSTVDDLIHLRLGDGNPTELLQKNSDDLVKEWNNLHDVWDSAKTKAKDMAGNVIEAAKHPLDLKPFEALMNAQKDYLAIFKAAKVPMNVASHVVAHLSNFFMGAMTGLPVHEAEYVNSIREANKLVRGKMGAKGLKEMFFNDTNSFVDFLDNHPERFRQLTGMDPQEIANKITTEQKVVGVLGGTMSEVKKFLTEAFDSIEAGISQSDSLASMEKSANEAAIFEATASPVEKAALKEKMGRYSTPSETLSKLAKEAPVRETELAGSWAANEIQYSKTIEKIKAFVAKEASDNPKNVVAQVAEFIVNKMPKAYEQVDQTWKLGTTDFLSRVGLTEGQLQTVSRTVQMNKDDLLEPVISGGQKRYKLTPLKASDVAQETYMNYAAMPDFVKVMRAIPIAGAPFLSFQYAIAIKTAKTAISNPAVFNKIGFLLSEISGSRTPQEKIALEQKYNEYLKSPTVVKMFGMWNTDAKNFVPYYTMNMLNPSERTYGDSAREQVLKALDKFPVLQDPIGSVLKDYFIQPWLLSGTGQVAQGQFGQPLYPSYDENGNPTEASLGTKAFYGARSVAESVVPGALSYAGIIPGVTGASPEAINLIPSYGARSIANAAQGRSTIGAMTKENAVQKTLRAVLGRTGIPAYTLDTTTTSPSKNTK